MHAFDGCIFHTTGRVVKKPSWADAYTTEDDGYDWTPERLPKKSGKKEKDPDAGDFASPNRNFTDSFRPRAAPTFAKEASRESHYS